MKKYFSKYLPVAGEIKKGDKYWFEGEGKGYFRVFTAALDFVEQEWKKAKKVKLFLCSRDIQVGDKLTIRQYNGDPDWEATFDGLQEDQPEFYHCRFIDVHNNSRFGVMAKDALKVIGEISPDALSYVKEGDEFADDQLRLVYMDDEGNMFYSKEAAAWDGYTGEYTDVYQIKCPTCGKFE